MKKNHTAALSIFFMVLLMQVAILSYGQNTTASNAVTGTITDESGKPMDYATVSLLQIKDSTVIKGTLTNEVGVYDLSNVSSGIYLVIATSVGYDNAKSNPFTIAEPQAGFTVPVIIMHIAVNALKAVEITATQPLIEYKPDKTVINVANSALAAGNNALEILGRAPGVTLDQDENISLRGKKGVTVMINDKLTYLSPAQLATLLKSTDGTTIQSIEIITNPSAKYDAAGSSGIINIKLKKNGQSCTNGSFTAGAGYGQSWKDNGTLLLNHREGALNIYGSLSHQDIAYGNDIVINRIVADSSGHKNYFRQASSSPYILQNNSYRIGADYDLTSNNTVGAIINGYFDELHESIASNTNIGDAPGETSSYLNTFSQMKDTYHNFAVDLNDKIKLDTLGRSFSVALDYSGFNNGDQAQHNTFYYNPDGSAMMTPGYLRQQSPSVITIYTAKADYSYPFSKGLQFDAGVKYSDVKTDNNLTAQQQINGLYANDSTLSNHFIYSEKISAGYINFTEKFKTTSVIIGLRGEYTASTGNLVTTNSVVNRNYFDLFPSLFIHHTINDKSEAGFSYSRRIDRPAYDNLNPFIYYIDQYTYAKGNPFLDPQYTNSFEVSYTYNKRLNVSFNYSRTNALMSNVLLTNPVGEATYQTTINLQSENAYTININAPLTIFRWWTINVDVNGFYFGFKSDSLLGANFNRGKAAYQAKLLQSFQLPSHFKAELISSYSSSLEEGIFQVSPIFSTDAAISHSFADKRANIKLAVSDVFNTLKDHVVSDYQTNNIELRQKRETRVARLTFTYQFGSDKIKSHTHVSGVDDLSNRVKGSN